MLNKLTLFSCQRDRSCVSNAPLFIHTILHLLNKMADTDIFAALSELKPTNKDSKMLLTALIGFLSDFQTRQEKCLLTNMLRSFQIHPDLESLEPYW